MFTKIFTGSLLLLSIVTTNCLAQVVKIPDANFKAALIREGVDTNGDGQIQLEEAKKVTVLYVGKADIVSLEGIKSFTNLVDFGCHENKIKLLDVSGLTNLKFVYGFDNEIETILTKGCVSLVNISCHSNKLKSIDVSHLKKLVQLCVGMNQIVRLDVSNLPDLKKIEIFYNGLREIKFNNCPEMLQLFINNNEIGHHLDFRGMPKLQIISARKNPIPSIDVRGLAELERLSCDESNIKTLNLSGTVKLNDLSWY
jgi:Leucine-rich repeat (LRR) protein